MDLRRAFVSKQGGRAGTKVGHPAEHDVAAAVVDQRLRRRELAADPAHPAVTLRSEAPVPVAAQVVVGGVPVGAVAVHQEHVAWRRPRGRPLAYREEVGARRVLGLQRPLTARSVERSLILPADKIGRGEQAGAIPLVAGAPILAADQRAVAALLVPCGGVEHDVLVALLQTGAQ